MGFKFKSFLKKIAPVIMIAAVIVNPAIAMSVGTSMGFSGAAAAAAGAATIQTGVSLALGATPEQAIKAGAIAGVTAGVGSEVAGATGSNVVGGATGSAVGTAAAGGSSQDIIRNAAAGGVANGLADAGSASAGKAAGALITTGGDTNAAIKAAVTTELIQAGQQGYRDYSATKTAELNQMNSMSPEQFAAGAQQLVETAKSQPGTQLAQADTGIVSDAPQGGMLPEVVVTATPEPAFDPALTFTGTTQPKAPSAPSSPSATAPVAPVATAPAPTPTRDQQILDLINQPPSENIPTLPEVTVTATQEKEKEPQTFTDLPTPKIDTTPVAGETPAPSEAPAGEKSAEKPSSKKTPSPITYTGVTPLAQTLGTSFSFGSPTSGTTVGLTGERGAGEIESKETGKKRKNVWNEASLRLKDALGV
jgi:hypothetical protein